MKPLQYMPFLWVDNKESLDLAITEINEHLKECNLLAVDLEYHNFAKHTSIVSLLQLSTSQKDYVVDVLRVKNHVTQAFKGIF